MPSAWNVTLPCAPCVTDVTVRDGSSKLSADAPLVPVSTLNVTAVSSFVATVSLTMSVTGVMVSATLFAVVSEPSPVLKDSVALPL